MVNVFLTKASVTHYLHSVKPILKSRMKLQTKGMNVVTQPYKNDNSKGKPKTSLGVIPLGSRVPV